MSSKHCVLVLCILCIVAYVSCQINFSIMCQVDVIVTCQYLMIYIQSVTILIDFVQFNLNFYYLCSTQSQLILFNLILIFVIYVQLNLNFILIQIDQI